MSTHCYIFIEIDGHFRPAAEIIQSNIRGNLRRPGLKPRTDFPAIVESTRKTGNISNCPRHCFPRRWPRCKAFVPLSSRDESALCPRTMAYLKHALLYVRRLCFFVFPNMSIEKLYAIFRLTFKSDCIFYAYVNQFVLCARCKVSEPIGCCKAASVKGFILLLTIIIVISASPIQRSDADSMVLLTFFSIFSSRSSTSVENCVPIRRKLDDDRLTCLPWCCGSL